MKRLKYEEIAEAIRLAYYKQMYPKEGIRYTMLYEEVVDILSSHKRSKIKLSHTRFGDVLRQMLSRELQVIEDHSSKSKIKPKYYLLSSNVEIQKKLEIIESLKADIYKRIYQKLLLFETHYSSFVFMKNRERDLNTILLKLGIKRSELIPVTVDQPIHIPTYYQKWFGGTNKRRVFEVDFSAITTKFIYSLKNDARIQIAIIEEKGWVGRAKKLGVIDVNYSYIIKGFSIQEFIEYSLEENFELEDVNHALNFLMNNDMIEIVMLHKGQPRFSITGKEIYSFVSKLWGLLQEEVYYLIYNWVLSHKMPTKEEVQRLELLFGEVSAMELINYIEITKPKHTEILKTC